MRVQKRNPWLYSLGAVLAAMALGTRAGADVSSDRPGTIVIYPKVIADGTRDTLISLTNTRNEQVYAHCEYVVGTGTCRLTTNYCSLIDGSGCPEVNPGCTPGVDCNDCLISWQTSDFDVVLTRQQPTIWRVSTGRVQNLLLPADGECDNFVQSGTLRQSCPGLFLIGNVPPAPPSFLVGTDADDPTFRGELRCIQVTAGGDPLPADALKGEALIETVYPPGSSQISQYNSINIQGEQSSSGPLDVLDLNGIEYNACPEAVEFTHYASGAPDIAAEALGAPCSPPAPCPVNTEITLVPCRANFITETGSRFNAEFLVRDEFESGFSVGPVPLDCWANVSLSDLGFTNVNGATMQRTRVRSTGSGLCIAGANLNFLGCTTDADCGAGGVCGPISGILAIVEQFHETDNSLALLTVPGTDAANAYAVDADDDGNLGRQGRCRGALTTRCDIDTDCPLGRCRISTATTCTTDAECTGAGDFCDRCMNDEITFEADPIVIP